MFVNFWVGIVRTLTQIFEIHYATKICWNISLSYRHKLTGNKWSKIAFRLNAFVSSRNITIKTMMLYLFLIRKKYSFSLVFVRSLYCMSHSYLSSRIWWTQTSGNTREAKKCYERETTIILDCIMYKSHMPSWKYELVLYTISTRYWY